MSTKITLELSTLEVLKTFPGGGVIYWHSRGLFFRMGGSVKSIPAIYEDALLVNGRLLSPIATSGWLCPMLESENLYNLETGLLSSTGSDKRMILFAMFKHGNIKQPIAIYRAGDLEVSVTISEENTFTVTAGSESVKVQVDPVLKKPLLDCPDVCCWNAKRTSHHYGRGCPSNGANCNISDIIDKNVKRKSKHVGWQTAVYRAMKSINVNADFIFIAGKAVLIHRRKVKVCAVCKEELLSEIVILPCGCRGLCEKCEPKSECPLCKKEVDVCAVVKKQ